MIFGSVVTPSVAKCTREISIFYSFTAMQKLKTLGWCFSRVLCTALGLYGNWLATQSVACYLNIDRLTNYINLLTYLFKSPATHSKYQDIELIYWPNSYDAYTWTQTELSFRFEDLLLRFPVRIPAVIEIAMSICHGYPQFWQTDVCMGSKLGYDISLSNPSLFIIPCSTLWLASRTDLWSVRFCVLLAQ
jgi:hypothetical protein